jgi:2-keto-3-deoxy-L-rhamnonate aldolase RhmA
MKTSLGAALKKRDLLRGISINTCCPEFLEIIANSSLDWAFIDQEHSALDFADLRTILQILQPELYSIIRLVDQSEHTVKKCLDLGADGIIIPQIHNAQELEKIIQFAKYTPLGNRSVGLYRAQQYGQSFKEYLSHANDSTAVIALIENVEAVKNISEIVAVAGLSAIYIGPADLSASLGVIGEVNHPLVLEAIESVRCAAVSQQLSIGIYANSPEQQVELSSKGYNLFSLATDITMFESALRKIAP